MIMSYNFFCMYLCIDSTLMYNNFFLCTGKKFSRNKAATTTEKRKIAILHVFPNMTLKILLAQYLEFEGGKQQQKSDSFEQNFFYSMENAWRLQMRRRRRRRRGKKASKFDGVKERKWNKRKKTTTFFSLTYILFFFIVPICLVFHANCPYFLAFISILFPLIADK